MTRTQNAAVIGHPIGHTMSPFIQRRLFELSGIPMEYRVLDVPELSAALPELRALDCFNVTIPHKSAIIPYLDGIDDRARLCGSVNTVKVVEGKLYGFTTDGPGAAVSLKIHSMELDTKRYDLLINTTSVGMYPKTGMSPVSEAVVSRCAAVFDAVFNPAETELLRLAEKQGIKVLGGMGMLVCQAAYSHKIWYDTEFQNNDLHQLIHAARVEMERIFGGQ